jgi:hypothetical protein
MERKAYNLNVEVINDMASVVIVRHDQSGSTSIHLQFPLKTFEDQQRGRSKELAIEQARRMLQAAIDAL